MNNFYSSNNFVFRVLKSRAPLTYRSFSSSTDSLIKSLTVRTCVGLYPKLRQLNPKLYPTNAPTDGLDLTVKYADTSDGSSSSYDKTIVAVHGNPGYLSHFDKIIHHYRGSRIRVIAPTLPDFSHTRASGQVFWHHTAEKVSFLKDFLTQLGVKQIDCFVSHSMGFQTLAGVCENPGTLRIKSAAIFAPQPTWDVTPTQKRIVNFMFAFRSNAWYNLLSVLRVHRYPIWLMKFDTINECLWLLAHVLDEQSPVDIHRRIHHLKLTGIPLSVLYGTKEAIISKRSVAKIWTEFGLKQEDLIQLDPEIREDLDTRIQSGGSKIKGYLVKGGGHFAFVKNNDYAVRIIDNLLVDSSDDGK